MNPNRMKVELLTERFTRGTDGFVQHAPNVARFIAAAMWRRPQGQLDARWRWRHSGNRDAQRAARELPAPSAIAATREAALTSTDA